MNVQDVQFVKGVVRWADLPADGLPEVAFIGRSNVGKSSLLNALVGRRALARTSGTPGKTQELNYYLVGGTFYLVDLPGFGYAKVAQTQRARWARLIERYLAERAPLRLVVHLVDSRHPPTRLDEQVIGFMKARPVPYLIALTKTDKLSANQVQKSLAGVNETLARFHLEVPVLPTSARTKRGRDELWAWVVSMLGEAAPPGPG